MSGEISIDLNNIGATVNNSTQTVERITEGVANQGALIGEFLGLGIALGFIIVLLIAIIAILPTMVAKFKGYRGLSK